MTKTWVIFFLVVLAAFSRLVPHPSNFTAIGAMAIFSTVFIPNRWLSLFLPLVAMWMSDIVLNNTLYASYSKGFIFFSEGVFWIYAGILAHGLAAWWLAKQRNVVAIAGASALGAILFFLLSNFGVWWGSSMYAHDWNGLTQCFVLALPFFGNFLAADLFYCGILFGIHYFLERNTKLFQVSI